MVLYDRIGQALKLAACLSVNVSINARMGLRRQPIAMLSNAMVKAESPVGRGKDGNATRAYIAAGYSAKGAQQSSARLLSNAVVCAEIAKLKAEYAKAAGIDLVWVLEQYKAHVDAELPDLFDEAGALLPPKQWPAHMKRLVLKVKMQELEGGLEVKEEGATGETVIRHVPMFTKEVTLEPKLPALGKLLDWVTGVPAAAPTSVTNNVQINVDKAIVHLRALLTR